MNRIIIKAATPDDCGDLFAWRNDLLTRQVSKNSGPVDWETHVAWFAAALASPDRSIYIGYSESKKIGSIRFDRTHDSRDALLVSIMIAPAERGRGYGKALLRSGIATLPDATLKAEIATENLASQRIFKACGFEQILDGGGGGFLRYRRVPDAPSGP